MSKDAFFQEESLSYCDPLKVVNVIFVQVEKWISNYDYSL